MTDGEWARQVLNFTPGTSELVDRLEAIQKHVGGQERLSALTGLSVSGVKAWRGRGSEPGLLATNRLSQGSGISLDYIARGEVRTVQDVLVEEVRLELAKAQFTVPSSEGRRSARLRAIQAAARALEQLKEEVGHEPPPDQAIAAPEFAAIPRYKVAASAGSGVVALTETVQEHLAFRRDWLHSIGVAVNYAALLTSTGDSMFPTIPDAALMLVDTNPDQPIRSGFIYVIVLHGDVLVKRVSRNVDGTIDLLADNPIYPKQTIGQEELDRLNIAGRVAWVAHSL